MKRFLPVLALLSAIAFQPAMADVQANTCLNPHFSYRAQVSGYHDVVAENTIGADVVRVRLTTSCTGLHNADTISLNTAFGCLGKGDDVVAISIDGRQQRCIVTNIVPDAQTGSAPH
jgi:hypothetical protein